MRIKHIVLLMAIAGFAGGVIAEEQKHMKMAISVVDSENADEMSFKIDSHALGFDLDDMQQGESRSIVDEAGRPILVTRTEDGFNFDVDGKSIDVPDFTNAGHGRAVWISGDADGSHAISKHEVHVVHQSDMTTLHDMRGTMIISPKPIDATTQQAIKSLLESAGYGDKVDFVDSNAAHGGNVMIKRLEKTVEETL